MAKQLTHDTNSIQIYDTVSGEKESLVKGSFRIKLRDDYVYLLLRTGVPGAAFTPEIKLDYTQITTPSGLTSASDLFDELTSWVAQGLASSGGGGGAGGGGENVYTNINNYDFTATPTVGTKNITITGLAPTLEVKNLIFASISKYNTTTEEKESLSLNSLSVSGGVITLNDIDDFVSGDEVTVIMWGPDKYSDKALDAKKTSSLTEPYFHRTDPETIEESNLGITGTSTGGDTETLIDSGASFDPEDVAEGFTAYQTTDSESALIKKDTLSGLAGDGGVSDANTIETAALSGAATWNTKDYSLPQVKRFEIPSDTYTILGIDWLLDTQDGSNNLYLKIYSTLDEDADTTDDIYWKDISESLLSGFDDWDATQGAIKADGIGTASRAVSTGIVFLPTPTATQKYMIKIVSECSNGTPDNEVKINIKKAYS